MARRCGRRGTWLCVAAMVATSVACRPAAVDDQVVADNNRGVALMGRFEYEPAREVFEKLVAAHPDNPDLLVNLAIATLNRQQPGDDLTAMELAGRALETEPRHLRALYVKGLLHLYLGEAEEAYSSFHDVASADSADPDAAYYVGQCLMELDRPEEAIEWYRRALALDPGLRSAAYRAFQASQRLGLQDEAATMLESFQRLDGNPQARLVEFKYTKMGAKGMAMTVGGPAIPAELPAGPVFGDRAIGPKIAGAGDSGAIVAGDLDGDDRVDLVVIRDGHILPLLATADGEFEPAPDHPLAGDDAASGVVLGDIDNDGLIDAYVLRRGPNRLFRQAPAGTWSDETAATGTSGGDHETTDCALLDADHDGDLDLFLVQADGPDELLNNDRDGGFSAIAVDRGISGGDRSSHRIVAADLDGDRDLDLVVLHDAPPHEVWRNDLLWSYAAFPGFESMVAAPIAAAVAVDADADGRPELVTVSPDGVVSRWLNLAGVWTEERWDARLAGGPWRLAAADVDGDGRVDLVVSDGAGWRVLDASNGSERLRFDGSLAGWALVLADVERGPSLIGIGTDGQLETWPPGSGRGRFVAVAPTGREDTADSMRSNASGIGTRLALRVGRRWAATTACRHDSGPGQGLQPAWFGIGTADRADFVAIDWSDGVYQTELDLAAGEVHRITETQRQLSSCPVVFAWDGDGWAFVSDVLGVGGMGYAVAPGEYAPPRPWERFLMPEGLPVARDGRIAVKLAEPMEESTYLDRIGLDVWDLPPGWSMVLDERMGISGPEPTGEPLFFRRQAVPVRASNDRGDDVTDTVVAADLRAAPPGPVDHRFIGLLTADHVLTLEFEAPLTTLGDRLALVADGWVEYPYSQTNFAAWQAGETYDAPTLEVRRGDGTWHVVAEQFGYPAGMPRTMALPLPPLPAGTDALRLTTNQEIYWDRLAVVAIEPCPEALVERLRLLSAELREAGFAHRTTGPQRLPHYDDSQRAPLWDARHQAGWYTDFGPVVELVAETDDALAIFGPGEEIEARFAAPAADPPSGWTRRFVLATDGWCKDMDLYTKDGTTLEPIPNAQHGDPGEVAAIHGQFNRRLR